jgi:hypothetical protein
MFSLLKKVFNKKNQSKQKKMNEENYELISQIVKKVIENESHLSIDTIGPNALLSKQKIKFDKLISIFIQIENIFGNKCDNDFSIKAVEEFSGKNTEEISNFRDVKAVLYNNDNEMKKIYVTTNDIINFLNENYLGTKYDIEDNFKSYTDNIKNLSKKTNNKEKYGLIKHVVEMVIARKSHLTIYDIENNIPLSRQRIDYTQLLYILIDINKLFNKNFSTKLSMKAINDFKGYKNQESNLYESNIDRMKQIRITANDIVHFLNEKYLGTIDDIKINFRKYLEDNPLNIGNKNNEIETKSKEVKNDSRKTCANIKHKPQYSGTKNKIYNYKPSGLNSLLNKQGDYTYSVVFPMSDNGIIDIPAYTYSLQFLQMNIQSNLLSNSTKIPLTSYMMAFEDYYYNKYYKKDYEGHSISFPSNNRYNFAILDLYSLTAYLYSYYLLKVEKFNEAAEIALFAGKICPKKEESFYEGCDYIIQQSTLSNSLSLSLVSTKEFKNDGFDKAIKRFFKVIFN